MHCILFFIQSLDIDSLLCTAILVWDSFEETGPRRPDKKFVIAFEYLEGGDRKDRGACTSTYVRACVRCSLGEFPSFLTSSSSFLLLLRFEPRGFPFMAEIIYLRATNQLVGKYKKGK